MLGHWAALLPHSLPPSPSPIDAASLGTWALQFTPRVALLEEAVVAEVSGCARLFGGMEQLRLKVQAGAEELGARVAWAPTATAALALARQGAGSVGQDGFEAPLARVLDPLPLHAITAVGQHQATLARVGCRTLGDVRTLPRGGLSRRFGKALLAGLDQTYGLRPEVHAWVTLPETFHARLELMSRVETAPALLAGARRLLVQMAGWLAARRLGATAFTLRWCHDVMRAKDAGTGGEITVRTAQPMQNVEHFSRLLAEHLAKVTLLAPAGDIELLASEVAPLIEESRSLIPETLRQGADTDLALERIQARLGQASVQRPVLHADHRLEWMQGWDSAPTAHRHACSATTGWPAARMPVCCGCSSSAWRGTRPPGSCMGTLAESPAMNRLSRSLPDYAELRCISNFTFLRGASRPEELVERAKELGYQALAITDECNMAGVVRAHGAAKAVGLPLLLGSQFGVAPRDTTEAPFVLVVLAQNLQGYGNLCAFITKLRRASEKGSYHLTLDHITGVELADCLALLCPDRQATDAQLEAMGRWTLGHFTGRCWIGVEQLRRLDDELWLHRLRTLSELTALPLVAVGDVHMHVRSRKPLQDVLTATRIGKPLTECGHALQRSAEQHLRTRLRLAQTFPAELLAETLRVAARCHFSLDELKYQYPDEVVPPGHTAASYLRQMTYEGAGRRWPQGIAAPVQTLIEHELAMICELRYEHYFLTVYDIVAFARSRHILCQGRGSAANSVVCYCLGVTEVDPARMSVLFERFISKERNEPPDIDIDFEHDRREEVIQYLYQKYGRDRAALTATVIRYQPRSAIRDVGKALVFDLATVDAIAKGQKWFDGAGVRPERFEELGIPADDLAVRQLITLTQQLMGFPRHLSQHTGGFVLTRGLLCRMVPVENAAMPERTVIEWDKDDLDAAGLLKVDVLALGMLSAIRRALDLIGLRRGQVFSMQDIPAEDSATYDMICQADTIGVFQIESRAQMGMLPRLRPRCFYDLVIEVAIVRPGPIQGGMVHPYLNRRQGKEPVTYPSEALRTALGRTLGVPVFQEQVMQIAMLAAGFTPGEADGLRRAMAAWKRKGGLEKYYHRLVDGMTSRGYALEFAEAIFEQVKGFSEYGFPESHAASFALLVYASAWIKRHEPAAFLVALLNSQPMGFYTPSQLVQDARRHGVEVRPVDVMHSRVESTLEDLPDTPAFWNYPPRPRARKWSGTSLRWG